MPAWRAWVALALILGAPSLHARAPAQDRPAFRGGISLVEVSAVVTDEEQRTVGDLTPADFEVFEDGEQRPIASVRYLATARAPTVAAPSLPPGLKGVRWDEVVTNRDLADAPAFVLLLDDLNVSAYDSHRAIRAALGALGALPPDALVGVVNTSGDGGALLTMARPNQSHAERVKAFRGQYLTPSAGAAGPSSVDTPCSRGADSPDCMDPTRAARRANALGAVGELFARTGSRRKVLLWLVTDMGVSPLDPKGNGDAQFAALQRLLRGDVTVYPIDPRENFAPTEGKPVYNDRGTGGRMRVGTADTTFQGPGGAWMALGTDDMVRVPLSQIARDTGGRWIQNANNGETLAAEVVAQNLSSYVVAYESAAASTPGRHRIDLKVKRRGVKVSSRRVFVVSDGAAEPESAAAPAPGDAATTERLRQVILGGVPFGTLALHAHVAPQLAADGPARALVTVRVDADSATDADRVDLLLLVAADDGKVASVERFAMHRPTGQEAWEGSLTLPLERGRYQLRVAASTPDGGHTGLLLHPIEIAPGDRELALGVPTLLAEHPGEIRPTLSRTFPPGLPLAYQVEVAGRAVRQARVGVRARLIDAWGNDVRQEAARLEPVGPTLLRATGVVSTEGLPPGTYTLLVEAGDVAAGAGKAHAIPVRLEPRARGVPTTAGITGTSGVTATGAATPAAPKTAPRELASLPVASGPLTRSAQRGPRVIRTEGEWGAFWSTLPTRQAAPPIDFDRVTLLALVAEGDVPVMPRITRITTEPAGAVVVEWTSMPMDNPPSSAEPLRPFVVVGLTGVAGHVRFQQDTRTP